MNEYILTTHKLIKKYGKQTILNNISMEIKRGEIYGFIGVNGAGKTSLIRLIMGLSFPSSGEMKLFDATTTSQIAIQRKRIGCIVEKPALYEDMSARQNLEVQRIQKGIPGKDCIEKVLELVNLTTTDKKKVKHFSLGMKQRLALAIALLGDPEFLILDEPLNGLDPMGIVELRNLLKKLNEERNITILISSHILSELHQLATCYGIIHQGSLIEQLSTHQLNEKCKKHIYLKVDDAPKAITLIEKQLHTSNLKVYPDNIIKLYDYLDQTSLVSSLLTSNQIMVHEISIQGDDLESYFTNLIGGISHV